MKIQKLIKNTLLGIGIVILSTLSVHAGFGVSPTNIDSQFLKPGAHFEQTFVLSRSENSEELQITITPALEAMESWFTFQPGKSFLFGRGENTKEFTVVIDVPSDAQYQGYDGVIRVTATPTDKAVAGVSITQGVRLDAQLVVTEDDYKDLSILAISAEDNQRTDNIVIDITAENIGNVDASPDVKIRIMSLLIETLEETEVAGIGIVKPNETSNLQAIFRSELPSGEYFVEVGVYLDGRELRRERLVINLVQAEIEPQQEEVKEGFFAQLGSIITGIFDDFETVWPYVLLSLVVVESMYIVLTQLWKAKVLKKYLNKWWAIVLGSKMISRAALSLVFGLTSLLLLILLPLTKLDHEDVLIADVSGETQGVQDTVIITVNKGNALNVTSDKALGYLVYEQPDTNSKAIYTAKDGEELAVLDETDDWYKVQINDDTIGWIEKISIKSITTEDR